MHDNLVLAFFIKISLIFTYLPAWLFAVAFYEMSSFVYLAEYHKWPYILILDSLTFFKIMAAHLNCVEAEKQ